jgi:hypothetical protein
MNDYIKQLEADNEKLRELLDSSQKDKDAAENKVQYLENNCKVFSIFYEDDRGDNVYLVFRSIYKSFKVVAEELRTLVNGMNFKLELTSHYIKSNIVNINDNELNINDNVFWITGTEDNGISYGFNNTQNIFSYLPRSEPPEWFELFKTHYH